MNRWKAILGLAVILVSTAALRADMANASYAGASTMSLDIAAPADPGHRPAATSKSLRLDSLCVTLPDELPGDSADATDHPAVRALPPAHGSLTLFLSAVGGLGAWHLGRSARKFRLGFIPAWYHSGGPGQVGHVLALNPDLTIIHAQRADEDGNTQLWGLIGVQKEACLAAKHVVAVVEEVVGEDLIRMDPNRTILPAEVIYFSITETEESLQHLLIMLSQHWSIPVLHFIATHFPRAPDHFQLSQLRVFYGYEKLARP